MRSVQARFESRADLKADKSSSWSWTAVEPEPTPGRKIPRHTCVPIGEIRRMAESNNLNIGLKGRERRANWLTDAWFSGT